MKTLFFTSIIFFIATTLSAEPVVQTGEKNISKDILHVNLIQVLSAPDRFNNKKIRFTAYVVRSNADTFLFNSKEDASNFRIDSALMAFMSDRIDLKLFLQKMDNKLLWVEGTFTVRDPNSAPAVVGLISISYLRYQ